ncbi:MAG: hypothetical protein M1830_000429 [Pleopsidium flavum]|nr:MAG: hypothetical protein M1830_000429 [Pleopsidium flavum]
MKAGRAMRRRPVAGDPISDDEDESEDERAMDEKRAKLILDNKEAFQSDVGDADLFSSNLGLKSELRERALDILRRINAGKAIKKGDVKGDESNEGSDIRVNEWDQVEVFAPVVAAAWHSKAARKSATAWQCIPVIPRAYAQAVSSRGESRSHQSSGPARQPRAQTHGPGSERVVREVSPLFVPKDPPRPQNPNNLTPSTRSVTGRRRTSGIPGPKNTTRSLRDDLRSQGLNPQQVDTVVQQVGSNNGQTGQSQQNTRPVQMETGSRITSLNTSKQGIQNQERRVSQPRNIAPRGDIHRGREAVLKGASRASQTATPERRKVKGAEVRTDTGFMFIPGSSVDDEEDGSEIEKKSPRKKFKSSEQALQEAKVILQKKKEDHKKAVENEAFEATLFAANAPPPKLFAAPRDLREQGFEKTAGQQKGQVHKSFDPDLTNPIDRHQRAINRTDMVGNWGPGRKPLTWEERAEFQRNEDARRSRQLVSQRYGDNHGTAGAHHQGPSSREEQASQAPRANLDGPNPQRPPDSRSSEAFLAHREPQNHQQRFISQVNRASRLRGLSQPDLFARHDDEIGLHSDSPPSIERTPPHPRQHVQQQPRSSVAAHDTHPIGRPPIPNTNTFAQQGNETRPTLQSPPRFVSGSRWSEQGVQKQRQRGTRGRGDKRNARMQAAREQSQAQVQAQMRFGSSAAPPRSTPRGPGGVRIVISEPVSPSVPAPVPTADWKISKWMADYQAEADDDPLAKFYDT